MIAPQHARPIMMPITMPRAGRRRSGTVGRNGGRDDDVGVPCGLWRDFRGKDHLLLGAASGPVYVMSAISSCLCLKIWIMPTCLPCKACGHMHGKGT